MRAKAITVFFLLTALLPIAGWSQSFNATIGGTVTDPVGATVPSAEAALTTVATGVTLKFTTGPDGLFRFPNLQRGEYELKVSAAGFREFVQKGIRVSLNDSARVDVRLELGTAAQSVEVLANASPLNFENAEMKQAVTPESLAQLPLIVSGNQRAVLNFVLLVPGVTSGAGGGMATMRINGGARGSEEGVLDGISMEQGLMSQGGQVSMVNDYPITPDAVGEVSVLTSNFEPQYGSSNSGVMTATTKSGTNEFHGSVFEFLRNNALNARQWGGPRKSKNIEHDLGANVGGPVKLPGLWSASRKTYFFFGFGRWYTRGATVAPTLSIPSLKERVGDFSDWKDASGNLIPVYDPATTRANPNYNPNRSVGPTNLPFLRDQFMGCDGMSPNVICASDPRLKSSMANGWLKFLPTPTYATALKNFVPAGYATMAGIPVDYKTSVDARIDHYAGPKDHIALNIHYHVPIFKKISYLPGPLASERWSHNGGGVGPWVHRVNWDHTFTPNFLNNTNFGYLNFKGEDTNVADDYVDQLPKIPGVATNKAIAALGFADFASYGGSYYKAYSERPTYIVNDMATWIRGRHVVKFGGEYRYLTLYQTKEGNSGGSFNFASIGTGLPGITSGNSIASFLMEQVNSASVNFATLKAVLALSSDLAFHVGDTWKVSSRLSVNYGLRWDMSRPSYEANDNFSFFDPNGVNPGAGNRPGRLAFAGTKWGAASFGAPYPESVYYRGFAPRLGIAFAVRPKTVVRSGYGIFYTKNYYQGWAGGMNQSGFNLSASASSSNSGTTPAFILSQGFPSNYAPPPFIDSSYLNGQSAPLHREATGGILPYTQQWNFTIEQQLSPTFYVNASYVGNKGTHLSSTITALNVLDPTYLSMGQQLNAVFTPSITQLNGVSIPYAGWVEQMKACSPTVAQALLPYPQYCGNIRGVNQKNGNSTYHSFQLKAEKRQSQGLWLLFSYTFSKLISDVEGVTASTPPMSPFQRGRNKSLASDDVPHTLSVASTYDLPFGKGKRLLNHDGITDKVFGGWVLTNIVRANSGTPFSFRSGLCNVPGQFAASCMPAILTGANPWAQDKGSFDTSQPLFNLAAFESKNAFNFYLGQGARVSNLRGFGYLNHDAALLKNTRITEKVSVQFRGEFFNIWNMHSLTSNFTTDINSQTFGKWTGGVTAPRNVQMGLKVIF